MSILPKPGELLGPFFKELNLPLGVPGVIEDSNGIWLKSRQGRGGRWHMGWLATCQRCGAQWGIRGKKYSWDKQKMPTRCPGCMSRQWMKKPEDQEGGNSAGSPTIARARLSDLSQLGGIPGAMALQELIAVAFGLFMLTLLWFIFNVARLEALASISSNYATEMQDPGVLVLSNFWAIIIPVSLVILLFAVLIDMQRKRRMAIGRI